MDFYLLRGFYEHDSAARSLAMEQRERGLHLPTHHTLMIGDMIHKGDELLIPSLGFTGPYPISFKRDVVASYDIGLKSKNFMESLFDVDRLETRINFLINDLFPVYVEASKKGVGGSLQGEYKGFWTYVSPSIKDQLSNSSLSDSVKQYFLSNEKRRYVQFTLSHEGSFRDDDDDLGKGRLSVPSPSPTLNEVI